MAFRTMKLRKNYEVGNPLSENFALRKVPNSLIISKRMLEQNLSSFFTSLWNLSDFLNGYGAELLPGKSYAKSADAMIKEMERAWKIERWHLGKQCFLLRKDIIEKVSLFIDYDETSAPQAAKPVKAYTGLKVLEDYKLKRGAFEGSIVDINAELFEAHERKSTFKNGYISMLLESQQIQELKEQLDACLMGGLEEVY